MKIKEIPEDKKAFKLLKRTFKDFNIISHIKTSSIGMTTCCYHSRNRYAKPYGGESIFLNMSYWPRDIMATIPFPTECKGLYSPICTVFTARIINQILSEEMDVKNEESFDGFFSVSSVRFYDFAADIEKIYLRRLCNKTDIQNYDFEIIESIKKIERFGWYFCRAKFLESRKKLLKYGCLDNDKVARMI